MRATVLLLIAALAAGLSCETPVDVTSESAHLTVDRTEYAFMRFGDFYRTELVATFANNSSRTVFLNRCDARSRTPLYQIFEAGSRTPDRILGVVWACPGSTAHFEVRPGRSRIDTLSVFLDATRARDDSGFSRQYVIRYGVCTRMGTFNLEDCVTDAGESQPFRVNQPN